jgi:hypothetical protein
MDSTRTVHGHRARPLAGGLSLFLLVTIAITSPGAAIEPLLAELSHVSNDSSTLRGWSGRIVQAVRIARAAPRHAHTRPGPTWDTTCRGLRLPVPAAPLAAAAPPSLVRIELRNLPPPAQV